MLRFYPTSFVMRALSCIRTRAHTCTYAFLSEPLEGKLPLNTPVCVWLISKCNTSTHMGLIYQYTICIPVLSVSLREHLALQEQIPARGRGLHLVAVPLWPPLIGNIFTTFLCCLRPWHFWRTQSPLLIFNKIFPIWGLSNASWWWDPGYTVLARILPQQSWVFGFILMRSHTGEPS